MKQNIFIFFLLLIAVLAGCRGIPAPGEKQARQNFNDVTKNYHPDNRSALPELTPDSSLSNYLAFALLNSPSVASAYYDWSASVENITVMRSMPDPQLALQAYIEHSLTSLMPGWFQTIPGPGKLKARGREAAAESEGKYVAFENSVLQAAFDLKSAYYNLGLLDEQLQLKRETLSLLENQEQTVRSQYQTGAAKLPDLLRVQSQLGQIRNDIANLEDSRASLQENFNAALGLTPEQTAPPMPSHFEWSNEKVDPDELLGAAIERNPNLKAMEADVRSAEASIAVAYKERVPDFTVGLWAEVYRPPFYWPSATMTLPVWRDKIAAEIAQAQANELAAKSRLKSAQIQLAVSFAEKLLALRETSRNLALIENELIPEAQQAIETTGAGYRTGGADFSSLADAQQMLLDLKLQAVQERTDREMALAELSLMVAGVPPPNVPFLSNTAQP